MKGRAGGRQQHFKNAAQLHQLKLDRCWKNVSHRLMEIDFLRQEEPEEPEPRITVELTGCSNGRTQYRVRINYKE